ncbi:hypothetical protein FACS1894190_00500 [Spirochaetia bacterium]|nr:hypothetical protein FACS1894190_00500 [Spirochaetia bacterium]
MMSINDALAAVRNESKQQQILYMREQMVSNCPTALKALKLIDYDYQTPKRRKGYNLVKRENKKLGFVYYVRYSHNGKMLPTKWNTHTNVLFEAEAFALQNKEQLVSGYTRCHDTAGFKVMEDFYNKDSVYFISDAKRSRPLGEKDRAVYERVIKNKFVPFLRERRITSPVKIDFHILHDFQDHLLAKGLKPRTINGYFNALSRVFRYLTYKELISENPCCKVIRLPVRAEDRKSHGCYELEKLSGVFNEAWDDEIQYLLCLLIYTTDMRNVEIKRIRPRDIIEIEGCRFIDIKDSKTNNGVRLVPLHDFVYKKVKAFSKGKRDDELLFKSCQTRIFARANLTLGAKLRISEQELEAQNITFYSGRNYWKTLMNSERLGDDIEEYFMGHRVTGDVSKLYNHKDKQGQKRMVEKAKKVFEILDRCIFSFTAKQSGNN